MHAASGLTDAIRASTLTLADASARHARVPPGPRAEGRGAPVRELDRHRPPVPPGVPPRRRGLVPLPQRGRLDAQRARAVAGAPRSSRPRRRRSRPTGPWRTSSPRSTSSATTARPCSPVRAAERPRDRRAASTREATAQLTAEGQIFEMATAVIRGKELRDLEARAADAAHGARPLARARPTDFFVYEDERCQLRRPLPARRDDGRTAPRARARPRATGWRSRCATSPSGSSRSGRAIAAGGVAVPLNAWWVGDDLAYGLADSRRDGRVLRPERLERLGPHARGRRPCSARSSWWTSTARARGVDRRGRRRPPGPALRPRCSGRSPTTRVPPTVDVDPDDDATIFYTSGTTGRPKGAVGTHRNACTNLMNLFFVAQRAQLRFADPTAAPRARRTPSCSRCRSSTPRAASRAWSCYRARAGSS